MFKLDIRVDGPASIADQLQTDAAIFAEQARTKASKGLVRLYSWAKPGWSCGYLQNQSALSRTYPDIVSRPTGGGIVEHTTDEIVFCLCLPRHNPYFKNQLQAGYFFTARLIAKAIAQAGFPLRLTSTGKLPGLRKSRSEICFAEAENYELKSLTGHKICGIAQRRSMNTILQQGTIKVGWLVRG